MYPSVGQGGQYARAGSVASAFQQQQQLYGGGMDGPGSYQLPDEDDLHLREQHANFRMGAGQRLQRASTHNSGSRPMGGGGGPGGGPLSPAHPAAAAAGPLSAAAPMTTAAAAAGGAGGASAAAAAIASKKTRRRWLEDGDGDDSLGGGDDFIPVGRHQDQQQQYPHQHYQQQQLLQQSAAANTGHIVRMRRGEAWSKFLAYEGCCQVCMREGAKSVPEAAYFLSSGCEPLRSGLGIGGLLLPQVLASHMVNALGANGSNAIDLGNEIVWDDFDADDRKLSAAAFMNHMSVMKVRVSRLELPQPGLGVLSRFVCRNIDYNRITVHFKLVPLELRPLVDVPYRLRKDGGVLPGSPVFELQPEHCSHEVVLEVVQGNQVLARGKVACRRLWQVGLEHFPGEEEGGYGAGAAADYSSDPYGYYDDCGSEAGSAAAGGGGGSSPPRTICNWLRGAADPLGGIARGGTGLWVNVYDGSTPTPGKVLLVVAKAQRELPPGGAEGRGGGGDESVCGGGPGRGSLKVSSCQAYDYILLAALKSQACGEERLEVTGEWAWLLHSFAGQYGVRSNYATMTHLRWVLRPGVASVSQACFDLLAHKLRPLLEQEAAGGNSLTQHEATMLDQIKGDTEELLKLAFENYYLLSSNARKGILDGSCSPQPGQGPNEFPPTALVAGVHLFEAMRDVFHPRDVEWLTDRFKLAAKGRWQRLAMLCEEAAGGGAGSQQEALSGGSSPLRQHQSSSHKGQGSHRGQQAAAAAAADRSSHVYTRMIRMAAAMQQDLEYDRRLQEVPRLLPSSLSLPAITAGEYCTNYVQHLRAVLHKHPPNQPTEMAIDMLAAVAQLQRYLEDNQLAVPRGQPGCIDALELFGPHVRSWITNSQESLCATCRSLEANTELCSMASAATAAAPPLGSSEEGGVAPICHEMLRVIVGEMGRYERVITHWPLFGPYLEAALCVVLRAIVAAVSRQCGMTRVRNGPADAFGGPSSRAAAASPYTSSSSRPGSSHHHRYGRRSPLPGSRQQHVGSPVAGGGGGVGGVSSAANPGLSAQWAWTSNGYESSPPRPGQRGGAGPPRVLLMVREAVLLNSLKRLMVAAPIYEATLNKWTGGSAAPPNGATDSIRLGYDDVAPVVGAQFAQVVKELRTEYSSGVASTCARMSSALASSPSTSIFTLLSQAKVACAQAGNAMSAMQQAGMVESLAQGLFTCLSDVLGNLAAALDSRVFVAMGRGLWDFIGRDLLKFVENLQEGKDNKNAWRTRQNASLLLDQINHFFRSGLVSSMEHVLQERDLAVPLHIEAIQKLLAGNTTALNMNFTPF